MVPAISREGVNFLEEKIESFVGGSAAALRPDFREFSPDQVFLPIILHFVQAVGSEQHHVAREQTRPVNFVGHVRKHSRREAPFAKKLTAAGCNEQGHRKTCIQKHEFGKQNQITRKALSCSGPALDAGAAAF
jgi:hypothetical protein